MQTLLFPDPRPLVERLGVEFFRRLPENPGVYLMHDSADVVLYVGKARNLRQRLGSYRVANPERMPRRHLRLLREVARIELHLCHDEAAALAKESELLRELRPRFNRAGTWPASPRFLLWRVAAGGVELAVTTAQQPGWGGVGPLGIGAEIVRASLARLLWCAFHAQAGLVSMPHARFRGRHEAVTFIGQDQGAPVGDRELHRLLEALFNGDPEPFAGWVRDRTEAWHHPFELAVRDADLEAVVDFAERQRRPRPGVDASETPANTANAVSRDGRPAPDLFSGL